MSPAQKIWLSVIFSVAVTILPLSVMSCVPGLGIPPAYWIFAFFCPAIGSYLVSRRLVLQSERLTRLHGELTQAHEMLKRAAESDSLTGVLNRGGFFRRLEKRHGADGTGWLLMLDMDHFKSINDRYGHEVGDRALQAVAAILRRALRGEDIIGRLGGEEFGIYLPEATGDMAANIAERLRRRVEETPVADLEGHPVSMTVSIGMVGIGEQAALRDCLRMADIALYEAKRKGRNQVILAA
ncbi:MAG: GGDEF domain-containing protein [Sphingobium sp.]